MLEERPIPVPYVNRAKIRAGRGVTTALGFVLLQFKIRHVKIELSAEPSPLEVSFCQWSTCAAKRTNRFRNILFITNRCAGSYETVLLPSSLEAFASRRHVNPGRASRVCHAFPTWYHRAIPGASFFSEREKRRPRRRNWERVSSGSLLRDRSIDRYRVAALRPAQEEPWNSTNSCGVYRLLAHTPRAHDAPHTHTHTRMGESFFRHCAPPIFHTVNGVDERKSKHWCRRRGQHPARASSDRSISFPAEPAWNRDSLCEFNFRQRHNAMLRRSTLRLSIDDSQIGPPPPPQGLPVKGRSTPLTLLPSDMARAHNSRAATLLSAGLARVYTHIFNIFAANRHSLGCIGILSSFARARAHGGGERTDNG